MPSPLLESLLNKRPTSNLYHYTSTAGLKGIVETKSLWASGIEYLNDTTEFKHAVSIIQKLATGYLYSGRDIGPSKDYYEYILRGDPIYQSAAAFVASLSEEGDKLSQWRAYSSGGGGFSIGFDPKLIKQWANKQDFQLLKCEYRPENQEEICEELIAAGDRATLQVDVQFPGLDEQPRMTARAEAMWDHFFSPFMGIAPAFKNRSFEEEREWRLVRGPFDTSEPGVNFRAGRYAVIPYREFRLFDDENPFQIEEIVIGPNPDIKQAHRSVAFLLEKLEVKCKRVREYAGSYRNW